MPSVAAAATKSISIVKNAHKKREYINVEGINKLSVIDKNAEDGDSYEYRVEMVYENGTKKISKNIK